ncbi:hypothetical protein GEOBRER4_n3151 [Citrifermentans bremense]|uniref:Uncharacterized protein n=1 Tax=Citrifermentans bremense TaxID=60035 RepID=A0A6S6M3J0_9BACT|nr:hypothetical protein [Citrifermentans bremense]BCG48268.1 hypothetical protein GEOBRER4_n3151 [Citrifermentans bremense]
MSVPGDGQDGVTMETMETACIDAASTAGAAAAPSFGQLAAYLALFMGLSWAMMYFIPTGLLFTVLLPASFYVLFSIVVFCPLVSGGWPFAPPLGNWKPADGVWKPGLSSTALLAAIAVAGPLATTYLYPRFPLFPVGFWWGIILFTVTLWYAFTWNGWPLNQKCSPALRGIGGAAVIVGITALLWQLVNLSGTPFAGAPYDPGGPFQAEWFFGLLVWIIVWIQAFSNVLSFQQWPFYKLPQPIGEIANTAVCILLGWLCWTVSLKFMSPTFSFAAVGGSIIGMQNFHGAIFGYYPFAKYKQPKRGICNFVTELVLAFGWIALMRLIMPPVLAKAQAAGLPFDLNVVSVLFTLHFVALLTLIHNFYFLRAPLAPSGPPPAPE